METPQPKPTHTDGFAIHTETASITAGPTPDGSLIAVQIIDDRSVTRLALAPAEAREFAANLLATATALEGQRPRLGLADVAAAKPDTAAPRRPQPFLPAFLRRADDAD